MTSGIRDIVPTLFADELPQLTMITLETLTELLAKRSNGFNKEAKFTYLSHEFKYHSERKLVFYPNGVCTFSTYDEMFGLENETLYYIGLYYQNQGKITIDVVHYKTLTAVSKMQTNWNHSEVLSFQFDVQSESTLKSVEYIPRIYKSN